MRSGSRRDSGDRSGRRRGSGRRSPGRTTLNLRIACDTSVLVSAFIASGPPSRVIEAAVGDNLDLVLLEPTMIELARILADKLDFDTNRLKVALDLLHDVASDFQPSPKYSPDPVTGDPDDDLILMCAVAAEVSALVSGDRQHLLPAKKHSGVRILTPQALLAELRTS
ncbi:MAG: PIN domain-containing protein [Solirubrobacterales bacterium]